MQILPVIAVLLFISLIVALPATALCLALRRKAKATDTPEGASSWRDRVSLSFCITGGVLPILALLYLFKATPIYQAAARLQIDREQENLLRVEGASFTASQEETPYLQTQYRNLKSRSLLERSIARF